MNWDFFSDGGSGEKDGSYSRQMKFIKLVKMLNYDSKSCVGLLVKATIGPFTHLFIFLILKEVDVKSI